MSRTFTIEELNQKIDGLIKEYESSAEEYFQELSDTEKGNECLAKAQALEDLKLELNDPNPIVNVTEKVQQSLNVITTNKIINDGLQ